MADYTNYCLQNKSEMTALGNAIRSKAGISGTLTVPQMTNAVNNLSIGTVLSTPSLTLYKNNYGDCGVFVGNTNAENYELYGLTNNTLTLIKSTSNNGYSHPIMYYPQKFDSSTKYAARASLTNGMGTKLSTFKTASTYCGVNNLDVLLSGSPGEGSLVSKDDTSTDIRIRVVDNNNTTIQNGTVPLEFQGETTDDNGNWSHFSYLATVDNICVIRLDWYDGYEDIVDDMYDSQYYQTTINHYKMSITFFKPGQYTFSSPITGDAVEYARFDIDDNYKIVEENYTPY